MWVRPFVLVLRGETGSNEIYWRGGETYLRHIYADVGTVSWRESHKPMQICQPRMQLQKAWLLPLDEKCAIMQMFSKLTTKLCTLKNFYQQFSATLFGLKGLTLVESLVQSDFQVQMLPKMQSLIITEVVNHYTDEMDSAIPWLLEYLIQILHSCY